MWGEEDCFIEMFQQDHRRGHQAEGLVRQNNPLRTVLVNTLISISNVGQGLFLDR